MWIEKYASWLIWGLIPLMTLLMHFHVLDRPLVGIHVWRQTQTQTNIRNFATEDLNILHPRVDNLAEGDETGIKRMEFPLMQWIFAIFYRILGDHILISRVLSFLIGMMSLGGIYALLRWILQDKVAAVLGTWAYCFSPAVYYYFVNPMPDNLALCLGIWGLALFYRSHRQEKFNLLWGAGLLLGLATAVKLPFILFWGIPIGTLLFRGWQAVRTREAFRKLKTSEWGMYVFLLPALAWYAWVIPTWKGNGIVGGIGSGGPDTGELLGIIAYNFYSVLPEVLLNYASVPAFLIGMVLIFRNKLYRNTLFWPLALLGTGLIAYYLFEANMILTIHDYYLFPFLPVLFLIVAYGIRELLNMKGWWAKALVVTAIVVMPLTAFLRMNGRWNLDKPGFNKDLLTYREELKAAVPPEAKVLAGVDDSPHVWLYYLDHKGWAYPKWQLTPEWISNGIAHGAKYLYTDVPEAELSPEVKSYLEKQMGEQGSIRVYKLVLKP